MYTQTIRIDQTTDTPAVHVIQVCAPSANFSRHILVIFSLLTGFVSVFNMSGVAHPPPDPIPHSVAETLQVTTEGHPDDSVGVTVTAGGLTTQPLPASSIPSVGASISVSDSGTHAGLAHDRSSSALLSLASSCSLTEILNAQQQALEQFQCQLQLAQQTEAINQRLDAIERTLNSLIQQKAQEDAAKNAAVAAAAAAAVVNTPITPVQLRPSQQLQLPSSSPPGSDIKRKLPRELCVS